MQSFPTMESTNDRVFIADEQYEWLPARVLDKNDDDTENEDQVKVRIELPYHWHKTTLTSKKDRMTLNKKEVVVNLNDYYNHHLPLQNLKLSGDVAELENLHEAAVLYQIKERHIQKQPYTRVGEIIIAVNPCQWISELYSEAQQRKYAKSFVWQVSPDDASVQTKTEEKKTDRIVVASSTSFAGWYETLGHEPHVYEVSASAYRGLVLEGKDQTIFVSGESGAGKTETVKIVLKHLANIDVSALTDDISSRSTKELIRNIVESSPVFEAFGNAKTSTNHNSSRFGKVNRLHFQFQDNGMFSLEGSTCDTYLLETSRVVCHSPGERNFHIFYQLLALAPERKRELLGDDWADAQVHDFRYLRNTCDLGIPGMSDAELAEQTLEALAFFELTGESLQTLTQALGVVLRLGNLAFKEQVDGVAEITHREELDKLAVALDVDCRIIEKAMIRRSLKTNQDELSVPVSADYARDACDALAKKIYASVFDSIVRAVNIKTGTLDKNEEYGVISLVDIFGFENFEVNRFEQLCVNYASEKLQQKYVKDNLRRYKSEYEREGIELFDFKPFDNSDIIELLEGPNGLINSLNEECVKRNGTSESFVSKVKNTYSYHKHLIDDKRHGKTEFGILHFAGPVVVYDASQFVERNSDRLPDGLLRLPMKSSNPLIAAEFMELLRMNEMDTNSDVVRKSKMNMTVMDKFRSQLRELMTTMKDSQTRYIRCIKPNERMKPDSFDHKIVMRQLRCAGLIAAVELSREAFPNKLQLQTVVDRFACLLTPEQVILMAEMQLDEKSQYMMSTLFAPLIKQYRSSDFTMPFACGKTRVYYRAGALEILETRRHDFYIAKATILQRWVRSSFGLTRTQKVKDATIRFQALVRAFQSRSNYLDQRNAAITIQSVARMLARREYYLKELEAFGILTNAFRAFAVRTHYLKEKSTASKIAAWYRSRCAYLCYEQHRSLTRAATRLSAWYRGSRERRDYERTQQAALICQAHFRSKLMRDEYLIMKGAALAIERWVSQYFMPYLKMCREDEALASTVIQSVVRAKQAEQRFQRFYWALVVIQSAVRRRLTKKEVAAMINELSTDSTAVSDDSFGSEPVTEPLTSSVSSDSQSSTLNAEDHLSGTAAPVSPRTVAAFEDTPWARDRQLDFKRLEREAEIYKSEICSLREEIEQVTADSQFHAQEIEAEYEEKLVVYEEEVLQLKQQLMKSEKEKLELKKALEESETNHEKQIGKLKRGLEKTQASHRDYLDKIMTMLDDTEVARKLETDKIQENLEGVKKDRDSKIAALKEEIKLLRSMGMSPHGNAGGRYTSQSAQKLSRKLYAALSPDNVLLVVKEAQRQPGSPQQYIEDRLSSKARRMISYFEEMVSSAEMATADKDKKLSEADRKAQTLQQKLVFAYENIEAIQQDRHYR